MCKLSLPALLLSPIVALAGCGLAAQKTAVRSPRPAAPLLASAGAAGGASADPATVPEEIVVEGSVALEVEDVRAAAVAIRAQVEDAGGRVTSENLAGASQAWTGHMAIRIAPARLPALWRTLEDLGEIRSKQINNTDVSKTLYDQAIQLENLRATLERTRQLLAQGGLEMKDILAVEKEMSRLRGEIEKIEGERRFLKDRVAYATIAIDLSRPAGVQLGGPSAKIYPGPRLSLLTLVGDRDGRSQSRLGYGVELQFPSESGGPARGGLEVDVFADADGAGNGVLATLGGALYSDFLGGGRNRFLNPYLGLRIGYAYLDGSRFAVGGGAGIELFKHQRVLVDANVRVMALLGEKTDAALVSGLGAVVAF